MPCSDLYLHRRNPVICKWLKIMVEVDLGWVSAGAWHVTDFVSPLQASYLRATQNVAPTFWKPGSVVLATSQCLPVQSIPEINIPTLCCSTPPPQDLLHCQLTHCPSVVTSSLDDNKRCRQKYTESTANGSRYNSFLMDYLCHSPQFRLQLDTFTFIF